METTYKTVMMKPQDHVAIALENIPQGSKVTVACQDQTFIVELRDAIDFGHKFAVRPIANGEDIRKYGEVIGVAIKEVGVGEHVHIHNLDGKRGRGDRLVSNT
ncbi:UxaA family hydrolase [Ammoniphilus sp. 3BR4]|uniref:UxaA family hydrolase n=1 Tax=Ammoniphilus sp. 3BR4 TaxID=3158265 RepID=UPI003465A845